MIKKKGFKKIILIITVLIITYLIIILLITINNYEVDKEKCHYTENKTINNWICQSKEDLQTAKENYEIKNYYTTAFYCEQAIEKGMKALILKEHTQNFSKTHNLTEFNKITNLTTEKEFLSRIEKEVIKSRYPENISSDMPYQTYNKDMVKEYLEKTEELIEKIKERINN